MSDDLPTGWVKTTLREVCLRVESLQPKNSPETEFTYLDIGGIDNENNRIAKTNSVLGRDAPGRARRAVRTGDILFSNVRTYLRKIALIESDYPNPIASTGFTVIRAAEGVSPKFLFFQILSDDFLRPLHALQTGSSYPAVRDRDVLDQPIVLPPTAEQERIAAKLDAAFSRMQRAETASGRARERLERYRSAVLNSAITGELTREWREHQRSISEKNLETGTTLLHRILATRRIRWEETELKRLRAAGIEPKNTKWKSRYTEPSPLSITSLPKLPEGWVWARVEQLGEVQLGRQRSPKHHTGRYIRPYLRVANVFEDRIDISDVKRMNFTPQEFETYRLEEGDILLNEGQSLRFVGRPAMYRSEIPGCCFQNTLIRFRAYDEMNRHYALIVFRAYLHHGQFQRIAKISTNLAHLGANRFAQLEFPLPPPAEQLEIAREVQRRLFAANQLAGTLEQQLAQASVTRQSLLREAFAGRLVPHDPKDEPVAALLERIRVERMRLEAAQRATRSRSRGEPKTSKRKAMKKSLLTPTTLAATFMRIGQEANADRLFKAAGCTPDDITTFYETLRATPEVLLAFERQAGKGHRRHKRSSPGNKRKSKKKGRFRLVEFWLEDFKNLRDYTVRFDSHHGLDVILGWNGTGKSNLFESLVIVFRDLYEWRERNRWPEHPMNGYRLSYEIDEQLIEIVWDATKAKRPTATVARRSAKSKRFGKPEAIARTRLPLPKFVFGYYSGPTNRLAEHFQPMNQAHYVRLRDAASDDPQTLAALLEQRRFFCAETHHAKYVLLAFFYKEDPEISDFLRKRLRVAGFESALFIIRKPRWAKGKAEAGDFWNAKGVMRRVLDRLRQFAIAPMVIEQTVSDGYRTTKEDHYYFFLPDLARLHAFAAEYDDARTFFLALESTDFSELIHDVKIQVRVSATNTEEIPVTFREMSEGEQQLLMVLGLMRFTKSLQSLVLLDEPDTHLNPHWSVGYLKLLTKIMSDGTKESDEQQTSQILMCTHDPLVIASLVKEQIHLLKRDWETGACIWVPASVNPRGLGFTGILTSEMFGFRSDLDEETLADLDTRVRLVAREGALTPAQKKELENVDRRLVDAGFSKASSDPYYAAFIRAWGRRYSELMAGQQFLSPEKQRELDRIARDVLEEAIAEVEKEIAG